MVGWRIIEGDIEIAEPIVHMNHQHPVNTQVPTPMNRFFPEPTKPNTTPTAVDQKRNAEMIWIGRTPMDCEKRTEVQERLIANKLNTAIDAQATAPNVAQYLRLRGPIRDLTIVRIVLYKRLSHAQSRAMATLNGKPVITISRL